MTIHTHVIEWDDALGNKIVLYWYWSDGDRNLNLGFDHVCYGIRIFLLLAMINYPRDTSLPELCACLWMQTICCSLVGLLLNCPMKSPLGFLFESQYSFKHNRKFVYVPCMMCLPVHNLSRSISRGVIEQTERNQKLNADGVASACFVFVVVAVAIRQMMLSMPPVPEYVQLGCIQYFPYMAVLISYVYVFVCVYVCLC